MFEDGHPQPKDMRAGGLDHVERFGSLLIVGGKFQIGTSAVSLVHRQGEGQNDPIPFLTAHENILGLGRVSRKMNLGYRHRCLYLWQY